MLYAACPEKWSFHSRGVGGGGGLGPLFLNFLDPPLRKSCKILNMAVEILLVHEDYVFSKPIEEVSKEELYLFMFVLSVSHVCEEER